MGETIQRLFVLQLFLLRPHGRDLSWSVIVKIIELSPEGKKSQNKIFFALFSKKLRTKFVAFLQTNILKPESIYGFIFFPRSPLVGVTSLTPHTSSCYKGRAMRKEVWQVEWRDFLVTDLVSLKSLTLWDKRGVETMVNLF
jgi:hypothetical protein